MFIPTRPVASLRLPVWFTVLAAIPLAALGWLGWRLLAQERALEQQRQRERLEEVVGTLAHDLDRALARWEDFLPAIASSGEPVSLPSDVAALAFDDHGIQQSGIVLRKVVWSGGISMGTISQDGRRLPYEDWGNPSTAEWGTLRLRDLVTGTDRPLTSAKEGQAGYFPATSRDGTQVAYPWSCNATYRSDATTKTEVVVLIPVEGGEPRELLRVSQPQMD
jgi:hypothetical protein